MDEATPIGSFANPMARAGAIAMGLVEPEEATDEPEVVEAVEEVPEASDQEFEVEASEELEEGETLEAEPEVEPDQLHTVRVAGEELQVPYDELIAGYSREADYRRKTMDLADKRKVFEAESTEVQQERTRYSTLLTQLEQQVAAPLGQEPDWDALYAQDPSEALRTERAWKQQIQALETIQAEQGRLQQQAALDAQQAHQELVNREGEALLGAMGWTHDQFREEMPKLASYGEGLGFRMDELAAIADHRQWLVIDKARRWDEAQKVAQRKLKPVRDGVRAATPGQAIPEERKARRKQQQALGNVKDAKSFGDYWAAQQG